MFCPVAWPALVFASLGMTLFHSLTVPEFSLWLYFGQTDPSMSRIATALWFPLVFYFFFLQTFGVQVDRKVKEEM